MVAQGHHVVYSQLLSVLRLVDDWEVVPKIIDGAVHFSSNVFGEEVCLAQNEVAVERDREIIKSVERIAGPLFCFENSEVVVLLFLAVVVDPGPNKFLENGFKVVEGQGRCERNPYVGRIGDEVVGRLGCICIFLGVQDLHLVEVCLELDQHSNTDESKYDCHYFKS